MNNRRKDTDLSSVIYGKVPPQVMDMERAVLGVIMLEKGAFERADEIVRAEMFYSDVHKVIYEAFKSLNQKSQPIDLLTTCKQLIEMEKIDFVGGPHEVTRLTNIVSSAAHIEAHCNHIAAAFVRRELIRASMEAINGCYDDSVPTDDILNSLEKSLTEVSVLTGSAENSATIGETTFEAFKRIERLRNQPKRLTGVDTGYENLNAKTHGWQPTDLIILAARPSVGKTAFALNLARNAALSKINPTVVAFFSLEMSKAQLTDRIISAESEVWLEKIKNGYVNDSEMMQLTDRAGKLFMSKEFEKSLIIDDTASITIQYLRGRARKMKRKNNVGLIIIDYLQLMTGPREKNGNREQEISQISRYLKGLAKELQIPIIALSQLSREVEKRGGKKTPQLSDLRESGAIEQDADMVMFLYRPEYYEITANEFGESNKGETEVSIHKNRNGSIAISGDALKFNALLHIQKFIERKEEFHQPEQPAGNWRPVTTQDRGEEFDFTKK